LPRAVCRSGLSAHGGEHAALSAVRREPEVAAGAAAVGLLHAQGLVDEGPAADLHAALGGAGAAELPVHQLVAERAMESDRHHTRERGSGRWAALARQSLPGAGFGHLWPYLEMAAVLDADLPRRPHGHFARAV